MNISDRLHKIKGSMTSEIFAEAKRLEAAGRNIIHLDIGQPDFSPPAHILEATADAVLSGHTSYTVSRGILELREEVSKFYKNEMNEFLNPLSDIIITSGAKMAVFSLLWSIIRPGDNAIILDPSWPTYCDIVQALDGKCRYLPIDINFNFDKELFRKLIDNRTKVLIINSPSNPTGAIISLNKLQEFVSVCAEYNILILSDEIYNEYVYEGSKNISLIDIPNWKENGVIINGFSKTFSMPSYRLGIALGDPDIISQMDRIIQLTSTCPANFAQIAGIVALSNIETMREYISSIMPRRRDMMTNLLNDLPVEYSPPSGAFYAWVKINGLKDSIKWAKELLKKEGVAIMPGRVFGPAGEGYIRISFANGNKAITDGIEKIKKFIG